jgi:hypothetical protein
MFYSESVCMCFLRFAVHTEIISLYSVQRLVILIEIMSAYMKYEVYKLLNICYVKFVLR